MDPGIYQITAQRMIELDADLVSAKLREQYTQAYNEVKERAAELYARAQTATNQADRMGAIARYKRLDALAENIKASEQALGRKVISAVEKASANAFIFGHRSVVNSLSEHRQALLQKRIENTLTTANVRNLAMLPQAAIDAAVATELTGLPIRMRLLKQTRENYTRIRSTVTQAIIRGDAYPRMVEQLKDLYDNHYWQADRVVRTETHRSMVHGQIYAYDKAKERGIEIRRMWVASLDVRTRPSHGALDGTYANDEDMFSIDGVQAPGPSQFGIAAEDINCRCRVIAVLPGYEPDMRRIKQEQGSEVKEFQTFEQWEAAQKAQAAKQGVQQVVQPVKQTVNAYKDLASTIGGSFAEAQIIERGKAFFEQHAAEIAAKGGAELYDDTLLESLQNVRSFGSTKPIDWRKGSSLPAKEKVNEAMKYFPRDWWDTALQDPRLDRLKLQAKKVDRGYFNGGQNTIGISLDGSAKSTAIHELSHFMELYFGNQASGMIYRIGKLEAEFHARRTAGESVRSLKRDFPRIGFRKDEVYKKDKFLDAYMGKFYSGSPFFELLSMGMEVLFGKRRQLRGLDMDYEHFILGLLVSL